MTQRELKFAGISTTVLLHGALLGLIILKQSGSSDASQGFGEAVTIEASLAFKERTSENNQPQKQRRKKYRPPEAPKIADDTASEPEKEEDRDKPPPDADFDIEATLDQNRIDDPDLSSTGVDELPQEGSADGSEWGTERDAKGDPYAGELKGRIYSVWKVPTLETGSGEAHGCVKLDKDGKVVDRHMKKKSGNANLDRSVELALKQAPDMEDPVPDHLIDLVTVKGICFRFTLDGN